LGEDGSFAKHAPAAALLATVPYDAMNDGGDPLATDPSIHHRPARKRREDDVLAAGEIAIAVPGEVPTTSERGLRQCGPPVL